jgi:hypothetical protein
MHANALSAAVELEDLFAQDMEALENGAASGEPKDDRGSSD